MLQDSVQRSLQNHAEKSCRSAQIRKDQKHGREDHFMGISQAQNEV